VQPEKEEETVPALLVSADGLSRMVRIPETTQYEVTREVAGVTIFYCYVGHYDGIFSRNQSQIIRVYEEAL
jgi:hypothetical protein